MTWPIWIGVTDKGRTLIGSEACGGALLLGTLADHEQIFPSQFPHRVAVKVDGLWTICTPREARRIGDRPLRVKLFVVDSCRPRFSSLRRKKPLRRRA